MIIFEKNYQNDPKAGILVLNAVEYFEQIKKPEEEPVWTKICTDFKRLNKSDLHSNYVDGWSIKTITIQTDLCLNLMIDKFKNKGGIIIQRSVEHMSECFKEFNIVINCTGLGSRDLFNDRRVIPCRGQVLRIKPNGHKFTIFDEEGVNQMAYIIPRVDDIIIGGCAEYHEYNTAINEVQSQDILRRVSAVAPNFKEVTILETKVGLRPYRDEIRVEAETPYNGLRLLIHNYGHGGSGWTVCWGCADEVISLLEEYERKKVDRFSIKSKL